MNYKISSSTRNQLGNAQNPYQGSAVKALCVCSAGLLRSPTIAKVLTGMGFNTRACGTSQEYALIPISEALLHWCDEVYVVAGEAAIINKLLIEHNLDDVKVYVLEIPDCFGTFDKDLEGIINKQLKELWDVE